MKHTNSIHTKGKSVKEKIDISLIVFLLSLLFFLTVSFCSSPENSFYVYLNISTKSRQKQSLRKLLEIEAIWGENWNERCGGK